MSKRKGLFRMRFIGKPGGELMKGAPGNYEHGKIYFKSLGKAQLKFWELIDKPPEVIAPPPTSEDDVFMFIPEEVQEVTMSGSDLSDEAIARVDPNAPAIIEPHTSYSITGEGGAIEVSPGKLKSPEPPNLEEENLEESEAVLYSPRHTLIHEPSRDELLETLKNAGVEVKPRTRTTTLLKMVAELGSQKDD